MKWMGDKVTNFGPRVRGGKKITPLVIADHISAGTIGSMDAWFRNPAAQASSHFGVSRAGVIHQYVRLENAAWTQGLTTDAIPRATAPIVREQGINPNLYCVSIEHEGYGSEGGDGTLTEVQFWTSAWLHKYIQSEVERIWGHRIALTPQFVLGHYQIDPVRKPFCPGKNFPWARMYAELAIAEVMDLAVYEERIEYRISGAADFTHAYAAAARVQDLDNKLGDKTWGAAAEAKLLQLAPIMPQINYQGLMTGKGIAFRIAELYQTLSANSPYSSEALRKLLIVYNHMITTGLL